METYVTGPGILSENPASGNFRSLRVSNRYAYFDDGRGGVLPCSADPHLLAPPETFRELMDELAAWDAASDEALRKFEADTEA